MNKNESLPLPTNTMEWLTNKNSIIVILDVILFALLYNFYRLKRRSARA